MLTNTLIGFMKTMNFINLVNTIHPYLFASYTKDRILFHICKNFKYYCDSCSYIRFNLSKMQPLESCMPKRYLIYKTNQEKMGWREALPHFFLVCLNIQMAIAKVFIGGGTENHKAG